MKGNPVDEFIKLAPHVATPENEAHLNELREYCNELVIDVNPDITDLFDKIYSTPENAELFKKSQSKITT